MKKQKSLTVVLGGGSALGFADIGFLQILEENGIKIDAITGSSSGSLIAGLYAYGYSAKDLEQLAITTFKIRKFIFDINFFTFLKRGVISGKRIEKFLGQLVNNNSFENL